MQGLAQGAGNGAPAQSYRFRVAHRSTGYRGAEAAGPWTTREISNWQPNVEQGEIVVRAGSVVARQVFGNDCPGRGRHGIWRSINDSSASEPSASVPAAPVISAKRAAVRICAGVSPLTLGQPLQKQLRYRKRAHGLAHQLSPSAWRRRFQFQVVDKRRRKAGSICSMRLVIQMVGTALAVAPG